MQVRDRRKLGKVSIPGPRGEAPPLTAVRRRTRARRRDGKMGGMDKERVPAQAGSRAGKEMGSAHGESQGRAHAFRPHGFRMRHVLGTVPAARRAQEKRRRGGRTAERGRSMQVLRRREGIPQPPIPHDPTEVAGRHANGTQPVGQPPRGDMGTGEDRGREGEGERCWDGSSVSACVDVAHGLVGAARSGAPAPLCNDRHARYGRHDSYRYRYRFERGRHRDRCTWRERDRLNAWRGDEHWHSSNITYLTQRLSWRVQGSGGGV